MRKTSVKQKVKRSRHVANIKPDKEPRLLFPSSIDIIRALNWYNQNCEQDHIRNWIVEYMASTNKYSLSDISIMSEKGKRFSPSYGAIARLVSNGNTIDAKYIDDLGHEIVKFCTKHRSEDQLDDDGNVIVAFPKSKRNLATMKLLERIDCVVDGLLAGRKPTKEQQDLYTYASSIGCTQTSIKEVKDAYTLTKQDFNAFFDDDPIAKEGMRNYSRIAIKNAKEYLNQVDLDLNKFLKVERAVRKVTAKPREKKKPSTEKLIKNLKFQRQSDEFHIASVDPSTIIGAKSAITFNTKYRTLSIYNASDASGLSVKGSTLVNFDETISTSKKLRKPLEQLPGFTTRVNCKVSFDRIKTAASVPNGRFNAFTIILKVF